MSSLSVGLSLCLSVCLSVNIARVNCGRLAGAIGMPFGMVCRMGRSTMYWMGVQMPYGKGQIF